MRFGRSATLFLAVTCVAVGSAAEPRPTLDDFYDRTRGRTEGFEACLGYCDGETLAAFLIGAQLADPTTDAVQRATAYGGRLGVDLGAFFGRYDVARTKLWADVLRVPDQNETVTDLAWKNTWFWSAADPDHEGLHVSFDSVLAKRSELEPSDLAELQLVPYQSADLELEATPVGPKVDKDASLALPIGVASRLRWSEQGQTLERRQSVSAALAFRGFLKRLRHHYQLDALRVKRTAWEVVGGDATSWNVSAGYQRLSPDVDWLQIWLLAGYAWNDGRNASHGFLAQLGAETRFPLDSGELELGPTYEAHFVLDQRTARFERVHELRLYYRQRWGVLRWGLAYQAVALEDLAKLHALTPELGARLLGLDLGLRYRFAVVRDKRFPGMPENRFNAMVDFVF